MSAGAILRWLLLYTAIALISVGGARLLVEFYVPLVSGGGGR